MASYTPPASSSFSASHVPSSSSLLVSDLSPASLDTLPILASILTRLQTGLAGSSTTTAATTSANTQAANSNNPGAGSLTQTSSPHISQSQTQHTLNTSSPFPASSLSAHATTTNKELQTGPLTIKDIPAATDDLKSGLKKARALLVGLPDMERGIEEQEAEIRELEAKIAEQRRVLEGLKGWGSEGAGGEG